MIFLIGGSSHAGKSTIAKVLSARLECRCIHTDQLARHPGRPWKKPPETVPLHVAAHYLSLSVPDLVTDVLLHYKNLWPEIRAIMDEHASASGAGHLVVEGSALWPAFVDLSGLNDAKAIWLTANDRLFSKRIKQGSNFENLAPGRARQMVEQFLARTLLFNQKMLGIIHQLDAPSLDVSTAPPPDILADQLLQLLQ